MAGPDQAARQPPEILHQTRQMPKGRLKMPICGVAIITTIGFLVLYSKKKPEATALDVAKVATGVAHPENTHPRS